MEDGSSDILIYEDGRPEKLLTGHRVNSFPIWTPDGERITFRSEIPAPGALYWQRADGIGEAEQLLHTGEMIFPGSWSPDGQTLVFYQSSLSGGFDLWTVKLGGEPTPLIDTNYTEGASHFSPDGEWLAYISNEEGPFDVYVEPFPRTGPRHPISTGGGAEPVWSTDGRTLYYRRGYQMMAVDIETDPEFSAGEPRLVFSAAYDRNAGYLQNFDVAADRRFLMVKSEEAQPQLRVILNWFEDLKQRVPTGRCEGHRLVTPRTHLIGSIDSG